MKREEQESKNVMCVYEMIWVIRKRQRWFQPLGRFRIIFKNTFMWLTQPFYYLFQECHALDKKTELSVGWKVEWCEESIDFYNIRNVYYKCICEQTCHRIKCNFCCSNNNNTLYLWIHCEHLSIIEIMYESWMMGNDARRFNKHASSIICRLMLN
jgi:hypothetical protein